ncbi:MAG: hypothetical protein QNK40_16280 [Desulfobacterales bacterium]|nr:hypothetical protein [Desulfobacterales bacterium]MDX2510372.1 hypothetical protein [Desulfobacterales bacterium]
MPQKDVRKIKVGKNVIGIIGLKNTLEVVAKKMPESLKSKFRLSFSNDFPRKITSLIISGRSMVRPF